MKLWRGTHPDRPSDGTCWAPDPCSALSFLAAGGLDDRGHLLTADIDTDLLYIEQCDGKLPVRGEVWAADDPAYRARFAEDGVDVLIYADSPALSIWWDADKQQACGQRLKPNCDRVHMRDFVCWRLISADARLALTVVDDTLVDGPTLTRHVREQYQPCQACGKIPLDIYGDGRKVECIDCAIPPNLRERIEEMKRAFRETA